MRKITVFLPLLLLLFSFAAPAVASAHVAVPTSVRCFNDGCDGIVPLAIGYCTNPDRFDSAPMYDSKGIQNGWLYLYGSSQGTGQYCQGVFWGTFVLFGSGNANGQCFVVHTTRRVTTDDPRDMSVQYCSPQEGVYHDAYALGEDSETPNDCEIVGIDWQDVYNKWNHAQSGTWCLVN